MSREFKFNIGPRSEKEEKNLLRVILRESGPDDKVTVDFGSRSDQPDGQATPARAKLPNDPKADMVRERLDASLDRANKAIDAQPPAANAEEEARRFIAAKNSVRNWWKKLNDAGVKVLAEGILKSAWSKILELWELMI
jgi:hypothetical protein